jgi:class 3 adenylate cyclase
VYAHGGFVVGYAGDAFNAFFPATRYRSGNEARVACACRHSGACPLNPQIQTVYGSFPLSVKAGMGFGETSGRSFKSKDGTHATYWFRGDSLNGAVSLKRIHVPAILHLSERLLIY